MAALKPQIAILGISPSMAKKHNEGRQMDDVKKEVAIPKHFKGSQQRKKVKQTTVLTSSS